MLCQLHPTDECPWPEEAIIKVSSLEIDARADSIPPARLLIKSQCPFQY